ncbi:MAG: hydroxymethylbilane synthase [Bacillota bacterium]
MKKLIVGTRGSKLALIQTKNVINKIKLANPNLNFEIKVIKTKGDIDKKSSLEKLEGTNFFTYEIQKELINGEIDLAIHSMKDVSVDKVKGTKIVKTPKREDNRDVIVLNEKYSSLDDLPLNAKIGTSSTRRRLQLKSIRDDLNIVSMRGNVDERIKQVKTGKYDGILLAAAGIKRLGLENHITMYLDEKEFIPACAQGILAIQIKEDKKDLQEAIEKIYDEKSERQRIAEREFERQVKDEFECFGSCLTFDNDKITLYGIIGDNENYIKDSENLKIGKEKELAIKLADKLKRRID